MLSKLTFFGITVGLLVFVVYIVSNTLLLVSPVWSGCSSCWGGSKLSCNRLKLMIIFIMD